MSTPRRVNWQTGTQPLSGESKKCALSTKNSPHHHTDPTRELVEKMSVLQGRTARARAQIEASTEHTSPFSRKKERPNPSPPRRRKYVKFFQKPSTVASPVSTVKPRIAPRTKSSPEKTNVPYSTSNTQTPKKGCQIQGARE